MNRKITQFPKYEKLLLNSFMDWNKNNIECISKHVVDNI